MKEGECCALVGRNKGLVGVEGGWAMGTWVPSSLDLFALHRQVGAAAPCLGAMLGLGKGSGLGIWAAQRYTAQGTLTSQC